MKKLTPILLAGLFSSGAVLAQDVNFDQHDKDGNGYLSQSEWRDVSNVNIRFDQADKDGNQRLSKSEVESATQDRQGGSQMESQEISSQSGRSGSQQSDSQQQGSQQATMQRASSQSGQSGSREQGGQQVTMQRTSGQAMQSGSGQQQSQTGQDSSGPEMSDAAFQEIDANSDSRISRQEAQQANDSYVTRTFDGIDVNGNGYIEKDEIRKDGK